MPEVVENILWASAELPPGKLALFRGKMCRFKPSEACIQEVRMRSLGGVLIGGWLEVPKESKGKLPALLRVPAYGQEMQPTGPAAPPGTIVLSLNVRGHGSSRIAAGHEQKTDYWIRGLDNRETYF